MSLLIPDSRAKVFKIPGDCLEGLTKKDGDTNWLISTPPGKGDSPAAAQITTDIVESTATWP